MHVDDFIYCRNDIFQRNVISVVKRKFKVGTHKNRTFKFFGLNVKLTKDGFTIDQILYASSIFPVDIKKGRTSRKNDELNQEKTDLKRVTGQMMWVAT